MPKRPSGAGWGGGGKPGEASKTTGEPAPLGEARGKPGATQKPQSSHNKATDKTWPSSQGPNGKGGWVGSAKTQAPESRPSVATSVAR